MPSTEAAPPEPYAWFGGRLATGLVDVSDDLAASRLVAPIALRVATPGAYYMAYRPDEPPTGRVRDFESWILEEARAIEAGGSTMASAGRRVPMRDRKTGS